jgi:hypothetical protein
MERFKDHSEIDFPPNKLVKIIIQPRFVLKIRIHDAFYRFGKYAVTTLKEKANVCVYERIVTADKIGKIRINHYFTKSYEEYLLKRQRGRATKKQEIRPVDAFYGHDRNEEKNDTIMERYIPLIYQNIQKRKSK